MLDNLKIVKKQKKIVSQKKDEYYTGQFKKQNNSDLEPTGFVRIEQKYWIYEGLYEKR